MNPRPTAYKAVALAAELPRLVFTSNLRTTSLNLLSRKLKLMVYHSLLTNDLESIRTYLDAFWEKRQKWKCFYLG